MPIFVQLPEDVFIHIVQFMMPRDLLSLKQTCRALYAFGSTDIVWRQVPIDLPLSSISPTASRYLESISAKELQHVMVRALQLDENWRRRHPTLRRMTRVSNGNVVSKMKLLRDSQWLIALSRLGRTWISLWNLSHYPDIPPPICFEAAVGEKISAANIDAGAAALIAAVRTENLREYLVIFKVPLDSSPSREGPAPVSNYRIAELQLDDQALVADIQVYEDLVAACIVKLSLGQLQASVILYHAFTSCRMVVELDCPTTSEPRFRLAADRLIILKVDELGKLLVSQHRLPEHILPSLSRRRWLPGGSNPTWLQSSTVRISDLELIQPIFPPCQMPAQYELHLSQASYRFSSLIFDAFADVRMGKGHVSSFSLDMFNPATKRKMPVSFSSSHFYTPAATSQVAVAVGDAGFRAVWIEHGLESDEWRIMKMVIPMYEGEVAQVSELFPPHKALPFRLEACHSLTFDDASGRLCFGMIDGQIHIMDFV